MLTARSSTKETYRMFRKILLKKMESVNLQFRSYPTKKLGKATGGRGNIISKGTGTRNNVPPSRIGTWLGICDLKRECLRNCFIRDISSKVRP